MVAEQQREIMTNFTVYPNRPQWGFCPSVHPSVCPIELKTRKKTKIAENPEMVWTLPVGT